MTKEELQDKTKEAMAQVKVLKFRKIVQEMASVYEAKNKDYGDSFGQSVKELGLIAAVVRMNDKMNRIKSLISKDAKVKSESIQDTLLDLANYAVMTLIEVQGNSLPSYDDSLSCDNKLEDSDKSEDSSEGGDTVDTKLKALCEELKDFNGHCIKCYLRGYKGDSVEWVPMGEIKAITIYSDEYGKKCRSYVTVLRKHGVQWTTYDYKEFKAPLHKAKRAKEKALACAQKLAKELGFKGKVG